jgi:hypothetical protein
MTDQAMRRPAHTPQRQREFKQCLHERPSYEKACAHTAKARRAQGELGILHLICGMQACSIWYVKRWLRTLVKGKMVMTYD